MDAEVRNLFQSSICSVHDFLCRCHDCNKSEIEYRDDFVIAYVRKGNFQFKTFNSNLDAYHGLFLINKPGYEYRVGHKHHLPDECTIISIPAEMLYHLKEQCTQFNWFFKNPDLQTILVKATPQTEYLHHCIYNLLKRPRIERLRTEVLITELINSVLSSSSREKETSSLTLRIKRDAMPRIQMVKEFIHHSFSKDIHLDQLAELSCMSPFHFIRQFKAITSISPYQYLLQTRLTEAQQQLRTTEKDISEIAFATGFNSLEQFSYAFKQKTGRAPSKLRS